MGGPGRQIRVMTEPTPTSPARPACVTPLTLVRGAAALLLLVHGVARISLGIVDDFGLFLAGVGLPFGAALAWVITGVEVAGGALLALGAGARWLAPWFIVQLLAGIALVHAPAGWFVVGAGRNGVEYSVLLVICLSAVTWDAWRGPREG